MPVASICLFAFSMFLFEIEPRKIISVTRRYKKEKRTYARFSCDWKVNSDKYDHQCENDVEKCGDKQWFLEYQVLLEFIFDLKKKKELTSSWKYKQKSE